MMVTPMVIQGWEMVALPTAHVFVQQATACKARLVVVLATMCHQVGPSHNMTVKEG